DLSGNEASFNPTAGVPIGNKSPDQIDSSQALVAVDCISTTTCTAIDSSGAEVTFNPAQPTSSPAPVPVEGGIQNSSTGPVGIACQASSANCVLISSGGSLVLFGPSINSTTNVDTKGTPTALGCASDSACVAVDASGNEVSINLATSGATSGGVQSVVP